MSRLKKCREAAGYSQKYVAVTLGVAPPQISKWEHGSTQPSPKNFQALADLYGVTVDYLMGRIDQETGSGLVHDAAEAELVSIYRQLTSAGKAALMAAAEGMLAQPGLRQAGSSASMG